MYPTYAQESTTSSDKVKTAPARAKLFSDREQTATATFIVLKIITPDKFQVTAAEVPDPNRLVFDFVGTKCRKSDPFLLFTNDVISGVRFGSHSDKMRVVIDVKTADFPFYEWKAGPKQLIIRVLESGKRPENRAQPTSALSPSSEDEIKPAIPPSPVSTTRADTTPTSTLTPIPSITNTPKPVATVVASTPQTPQLTAPKLPGSTEQEQDESGNDDSYDAENLLHPVEIDSHPTISVKSLEAPTPFAQQVLTEAINTQTPNTPAPTAATGIPTPAPSSTRTPTPKLSPTQAPTQSKAPVLKITALPSATVKMTATLTATAAATATTTATPLPSKTPTSPASPTATATVAPSIRVVAQATETPLTQPTITPTAVPTQPPITDFHLLNYRFDYLEPGRIPVLKLVLDKSRPQAQISKIDSKTYTIDILNCSLSRPGLALAQYPPAEFRGFLLVSSTSTDTRLSITINVDAGTTLGTFVRNNEIWVKRL
jgi:hypothetical protein